MAAAFVVRIATQIHSVHGDIGFVLLLLIVLLLLLVAAGILGNKIYLR